MNSLRVSTLFLWFMAYSIFGWVYETILCSALERKFVYRGFLNGPYCPIYGFGAVLDVMFLGKIENWFVLFLMGATLNCTLEYFTAWAMEKLFHAKWWDYSNMKFNIKGRICLLGALVFGAFSVFLIKIAHPYVTSVTNRLSDILTYILSGVLAAAFFADLYITLEGFGDFDEKLRSFAEDIIGAKNKVKKHIADMPKRFNYQERRMLRAFPKLSSVRHNDALRELKQKLKELAAERK